MSDVRKRSEGHITCLRSWLPVPPLLYPPVLPILYLLAFLRPHCFTSSFISIWFHCISFSFTHSNFFLCVPLLKTVCRSSSFPPLHYCVTLLSTLNSRPPSASNTWVSEITPPWDALPHLTLPSRFTFHLIRSRSLRFKRHTFLTTQMHQEVVMQETW